MGNCLRVVEVIFVFYSNVEGGWDALALEARKLRIARVKRRDLDVNSVLSVHLKILIPLVSGGN